MEKFENGNIDFATTPKNKREVWSNKLDFFFSCLSNSVGFGNVWRFPYLCYKNGGGAFLIPYILFVFIGGIPLFFLELSLGQYTSQGGIQAWKICPLMEGIGAATTVMLFLSHSYYIVIMAWILYYICASFTSVLPWSHCNNTWNTVHCRANYFLSHNSDMQNGTSNFTAYNSMVELNKSVLNDDQLPVTTTFDNLSAYNVTLHNNKTTFIDAATEYWEKNVLGLSAGIHDIGFPKWDLSLCLLFSWLLVYFSMWKGIKSFGKVMYVIIIMPYILMTILLVRGATLAGAGEGIKFYMIPEWNRLTDILVWVDAGMQVFFSYTIGLGVNLVFGSYNKFNYNSYRDCFIISFCNSTTSFFVGFTIFSVLGFMAQEQGVSVKDVAESGPGLVFIVFPKAVAQMPIAPLWSVLFFLMLFMLGLGCQIGSLETIVTTLIDQFPNQLRKGKRRLIVMAAIMTVMFCAGLTMVTNGGMYIFQLFDYFSASKTVVFVGFCQCITIAYLYGINKYYKNLTEMLGYKLNPFMKINWMIACPVYTFLVYVFSIYTYSEVTYNRVYIYPGWAVGVGWIIASSSLVMIPLVALVGIIKTPGTFRQRMRYLLSSQTKRDRNQHSERQDKLFNEDDKFIGT